jgi:hypothetical protein
MKILIALILFFDCTASFAEDPLSPNSYDYNVQAFQKTRALCQNIEAEGQEPQSDIDTLGLLQFGMKGTKSGFLFWQPDSMKVTPETSDLVHSDGYKGALYACFGDNEAKKKAFTASILGLDFVGHLVGLSVWYFPISFVVRIFRRTSWALANPGVMKGVGRTFTVLNRVAMTAVLGVLGFQVYENYQEHAESKVRLGELTESIVDNSKQESDASYVILQNMLDDTNRDLASLPPNDPRAKSLEKRKGILEDRLKSHHVSYD